MIMEKIITEMDKKNIKLSQSKDKDGVLHFQFDFPDDMTGEEQIEFFKLMADVGLFPPYPKE